MSAERPLRDFMGGMFKPAASRNIIFSDLFDGFAHQTMENRTMLLEPLSRISID